MKTSLIGVVVSNVAMLLYETNVPHAFTGRKTAIKFYKIAIYTQWTTTLILDQEL